MEPIHFGGGIKVDEACIGDLELFPENSVVFGLVSYNESSGVLPWWVVMCVCIFFWKVSQGERGACVKQVHQIKVEDRIIMSEDGNIPESTE